MKKLVSILFLLVALVVIFEGCSNVGNNREQKNSRDLTVSIENEYKGPSENNKLMKVDSVTDSKYGPDLNVIFNDSDEIIRGIVKNISYTSFTGSAWTKADILVTESYKGEVKKGDIVTIFMFGGYIKLQDYIKFFDDRFRFKDLSDSDINNIVLKEMDNGMPFLSEGEELIFPLITPAPHMPLPKGSFERMSAAGILDKTKDGNYIQNYYEEGKKYIYSHSDDEFMSKIKN
ncbi:MAG: hypothetical protein FD141_462 [Fusobacteria bacterium]|nr:MAG: hypothetical protein FD141_462 [Fusobacteriota bacterium]KAF0228873.1 MAG: hypothetical protein FD182_1129 [Fusobacteriota bacterium]